MLNAVHINTTSSLPSNDIISSSNDAPSPSKHTSPPHSPLIPNTPHVKTICINDQHTTPPPPPDIDHDITTLIHVQSNSPLPIKTDWGCRLQAYLSPWQRIYPHTCNYLYHPLVSGSNPDLHLTDFPTAIYKYNDANKMSLAYTHASNPSKSFMVYSIISFGKSFTQPLCMPDLPLQHSCANIYNSLQEDDPKFCNECLQATVHQVQNYQCRAHTHILHTLPLLSPNLQKIPFGKIIAKTTHIHAIKAKAERLLRGHQQLGHPSVLYFSFSVDICSQNADNQQNYLGLNSETSWVLISDHFTWCGKIVMSVYQLTVRAPMSTGGNG
eukprot:jgi/Psemu1/46494/gm1.46494_g